MMFVFVIRESRGSNWEIHDNKMKRIFYFYSRKVLIVVVEKDTKHE